MIGNDHYVHYLRNYIDYFSNGQMILSFGAQTNFVTALSCSQTSFGCSYYAKLKKLEEEREKELAEKYRDRVSQTSWYIEQLTHCGLVTPYGHTDLSLTLAQVMACCLTAPSHYLNQWVTSSSVKSSDIHNRSISQEMPQPSITKICLKITCLKFALKFPRVQWVNAFP